MSRRALTFAAIVPLLLAAESAVGGPATGQTTSTTAVPVTSAPPTTRTPPPPTTQKPSPPISAITPPPGPPQPVGPSTTITVPKASVSADQARATVDNLVRSGASNTEALLSALKPLEDSGFPHDDAVRVGFGHFPVGGAATYRDDFGDPRFTPVFHTHKGNDIFADFGTPVRATVDGTVRFGEEPVGGKAAYVTGADGTYYYYAHLIGYPTNVASGAKVTQGTVVGFVGDTGDAKGGSPHCHFEVHPGGGEAVNPKAILDGWLAEAQAGVPALLAQYIQSQPTVLQDTGALRRFDLPSLDQRARPMVEPILWGSSVSPAGSALRLAEMHVAKAVEGIDWDKRAADAQQQALASRTARQVGVAKLWRLTPAPVATLLGGVLTVTAPSQGDPGNWFAAACGSCHTENGMVTHTVLVLVT